MEPQKNDPLLDVTLPEQGVIFELEKLLANLQNNESFISACHRLHTIAQSLESLNHPILTIHKLDIPGADEPINLLLHRAVFTPELWGQTFAEGLLKDTNHFDGKKILEVGCGSGWISILLLRRTYAAKIIGIDINPVAILTARLNAYLNGTASSGTIKCSLAGVPLFEAFQADVSDLLAKPLKDGATFDHIIGCIPQVLHPDPEGFAKRSDNLSTQDLYDLSNYCFQQGILEDQFGLPLIARALEEAQLCLRPQGTVTLILGGRPGQQTIEEMFRRRGYEPQLIWLRRIAQADDTDLASLVALEKSCHIQFHFFMDNTSKLSIPASTAVKLLSPEQKIYHDLLVYRARTRHENPTFAFIRNLHELGLSNIRRELDFTRMSDEQISFLERLSQKLLHSRKIAYPHESGNLSFRQKLANFLAIYCNFSTQASSLFIGPARPQLLEIMLRMLTDKGDKILVSNNLKNSYESVLSRLPLDVMQGNDDLTELQLLDDLFSPKVSIIAPYQLDDASPLLLRSLTDQARKHPEHWYIVDDSDHFEISSNLNINRLTRLVGSTDLPPNLLFLYGLIKNIVCPDFELSFILNLPDSWHQGLEIGAELSYSRISYIIQLYYEWLFDELLAFPFSDSSAGQEDQRAGHASFSVSSVFKEIRQDPVFSPKPVDPEGENITRFDYGEFEYTVPDQLIAGMLHGILDNKQEEDLARIVKERICQYLERTRHARVNAAEIVLAQGVFATFGSLIQALATRLGRPPRIGVPAGTYGPIYPMLKLYGAEIIELKTNSQKAFVLDLETLSQCQKLPDLIWLTQPNNPSGIYYEAEEIRKLLDWCAEHKTYVLADEIFFLLSDLSLGLWTPSELSFAFNLSTKHKSILFLTDGLSKAFAAGGLRCGFMLCPDDSWATRIQELCPLPPRAILHSWDRLYSSFLHAAPHLLFDPVYEFANIEKYLIGARKQLSEQREQLLSLLSTNGMADGLRYARRGGLFLLAKLDDQAQELAREYGLLSNPPAWSRTPDWHRLCFSLESDRFHKGLEKLAKFLGAG